VGPLCLKGAAEERAAMAMVMKRVVNCILSPGGVLSGVKP
jgi:hypothetical protein